jgi:hypothetical protein
VRLKDGALYRGTLLEHTPGVRTVVLLHDGSQREFAGDAVAEVIAGAAPSAASAPLPPALAARPVSDGKVRLHIRTTPGYELAARKGGDISYEPLCVTECDTRLPPGPYDFKLTQPHGNTSWQADGLYDIDGESQIDARLASRRSSRIAGGVVLGLGVITGVTLFGVGLKARADEMKVCRDSSLYPDCKGDAEKTGTPLIAIGVVTALVSAIVGGVLAARKDRFDVSVTSFTPPAEGARSNAGEAPVQFEPASDAVMSLTPSTSGPAVLEAEAEVRQHKDAIRSCIHDLPATAEFRINESGAIGALRIFGDLETSERECLRNALSHAQFPAGTARAVSVDVQPALR